MPKNKIMQCNFLLINSGFVKFQKGLTVLAMKRLKTIEQHNFISQDERYY